LSKFWTSLISAVAISGLLLGCSPFSTASKQRELSNKNTVMLKVYRSPDSATVKVLGLRKFPYPYDSMLAIASDADHETLRKFNMIHEFLNTHAQTPWGRGVGLDISDSFFMFNGSNYPKPIDYNHTPVSDELTWFQGTTTKPYAAAVINHYIHVGWMDSIHTYGDFIRVNPHETLFTRKLAKAALNALRLNGDAVTVWIDHGNQSNVDNFGSYGLRPFYNYQQGANPNSPYYHTDLLIPYGVKFVWSDNSSSIFGHSSMIYPIQLPDGHRVWGFWRYTDSGYSNQTGVDWLWSADHLAQQLSYANLQSIEWNHQYAIIAQHLSSDNTKIPFPSNAMYALRTLADQQAKGYILVARTSRLLQYNLSNQYLRYSVTYPAGHAVIHILKIADPLFGLVTPTLSDVRGMTFYTTNPQQTTIEIGNTPIPSSLLQINPRDKYAPSVSIKWFAADTTNYAVWPAGVL